LASNLNLWKKISIPGFALNEINFFRAKINYSGSKNHKEVPQCSDQPMLEFCTTRDKYPCWKRKRQTVLLAAENITVSFVNNLNQEIQLNSKLQQSQWQHFR
jgi:hypothetical protein